MTHEEARSLLAFRAGLAPEREAELANHLGECPACRAVAEEYQRQDAFLRTLDLPEPAADLRPGVFARLDRPSLARRRAIQLLGMIPLGMLFILITILIHSPRPANAPLSAPAARGPIAPKHAPKSGPPQPVRSRKDSAAPAMSLAHGPRGSAQVVAGGLMLSISVDRLSYPRNALVPVTVRLQNVSGHMVQVGSWGYLCNPNVAWPEVSNLSGRILYPPAYPNQPAPYCALERGRSLKPGQMVEHYILVILRGPIIRGVVRPVCQDNGSCSQAELHTPSLRLRFRSAAPPHLVFHTSPRLSARLVPALPGKTGKLYVFDNWTCPPQVTNPTGYLVWRTAKAARLQPGCANPANWRGVAGWLNHSVVTFSYRRKH